MQIYLDGVARTKSELSFEYQAIIKAANDAIDACQEFRDDCEKENAKRAITVNFFTKTSICEIETNKQTAIYAIKNKLQNALKYRIPENGSKLRFEITQKMKDTLAELPVGTPPSKKTWRRTKRAEARNSVPYPRDRNTQTSMTTDTAHNTSTSSTTPSGDATGTRSTQNVNQSTTSAPRSKPIAIPRRRSSITDITAHPSTPPQPPAATTSSNVKKMKVLQTTASIMPPTSTSTSSCSSTSSTQGKTSEKTAISSIAVDNQNSKNIAKSTLPKQNDHSNNDKKEGSKPVTQHNEDSKETTALLPKHPYKKSTKSKHRHHHRRHHHKTKAQATETYTKSKVVIVPIEHHHKAKPQNIEIMKKNTVAQYFDAIPESEYAPQPKKQTLNTEERIQEIERKIDSITSSSCWCCFFGKTKEIKALQENKKSLEVLLQTTIN
jgi:hypothetical protein